jgi:hypothetical protein
MRFCVSGSDRMPSEAGWRTAEATNYLDHTQRPGFAWEFIRRDPEYRHDFARMEQHLAVGTEGEKEVALALAERWGLKFSV